MRVFFRPDGAQLRHEALIINLNADAAVLVRLVLEHNPEGFEAAAAGADADVDLHAACGFLGSLGDKGLPVEIWGPAWANRFVGDRQTTSSRRTGTESADRCRTQTSHLSS